MNVLTEIFTDYPVSAFIGCIGPLVAIALLAFTGTTDQFGNVPRRGR